MNRSDWVRDGMVFSDMTVNKQPDGSYHAKFPTAPQVGTAIGRDESEAVNLAKQAYQQAHVQGKLGN